MTADLRARLTSALRPAYAIERELGRGGMSTVFLARELRHDRLVAIKVLDPQLSAQLGLARFQREIHIATRLTHPNILPLFDSGEAAGLLYYTMPFVEGETLRDRLHRERQIPIDVALRIGREVADALDYAHRHGVIHRDIKPENILLEDGHAVVADFGIARALNDVGVDQLTTAGIGIGTPAYISPEQAVGDSQLDARTDLYSLGCVLFEMLAGEPPFDGPNAQVVVAKQLSAAVPNLRTLRPTVEPALQELVESALAKSAADRIQTAAELARALDGALSRLPSPDAQIGRRSSARRVTWGFSTLMLVVASAVAVYFLWGRDRVVPGGTMVAVAPFNVLDPGLGLWREGLADLIARNLDHAGPVRTVPATVAIRRLSGRADGETARALGRHTGATIVIYGSIESARDSVRLVATLLDVARGRPFGEIELREDSTRMDRLVDSLTVRLLRELGRLRVVGAVAQSALSAKSLPALKAFLQGEQYYRRSQWDSAIVHHKRALSMDSTLAVSYWRIERALSWMLTAHGNVDSVRRELRARALAMAGSLAPRESLLVAAMSFQATDISAIDQRYLTFSGKVELLRQAVSRFPDDTEAWTELAELYTHRGVLTTLNTADKLALYQRALELDPGFAPAYIHPIEFAFSLFDRDSTRRGIDRYLRIDSSSVVSEWFRAALWLSDPSNGTPAILEAMLDTLDEDVLREMLVYLQRWPDEAEVGTVVAREVLDRDRRKQLHGNWIAIRQRAIAALIFRGHAREAYAYAPERAREQELVDLAVLGRFPRDTARALFADWLRHRYLYGVGIAAPWWFVRGDTVSLRELASAADSMFRASRSADIRRLSRYLRDGSIALIATFSGDTLGALRGFESLPDSSYQTWPFFRLTHARILTAQDRDPEAMQILSNPPFNMMGNPPQLGEVMWMVERARTAERLGDREMAAADFARITTIWANPDAEFINVVAEARQALRRLTPDGSLGMKIESRRARQGRD